MISSIINSVWNFLTASSLIGIGPVKTNTQTGYALCVLVWVFALFLGPANGVSQNSKGDALGQDNPRAFGQLLTGTLATNSTGSNVSYVLSVNDLIKVEVYKEDDLKRETRVDQDGTVSLALIHSVKVAGRTVSEARELVKSLYDRDFLVNADVAITVITTGKTNAIITAPKLKFQVMGEVKKPGFVEIPENEKIDLVGAIGLAGDFTALANKGSVKIRRNEGGKEKLYDEDVKKMLDGKVKPFVVLPGDVITVRQTVF